MNSPYVNEGATCPTCIYQEGALSKEMGAVRRCKMCMRKTGRPGWDPKPSVKLEFRQCMDRNSKMYTLRRVIG